MKFLNFEDQTETRNTNKGLKLYFHLNKYLSANKSNCLRELNTGFVKYIKFQPNPSNYW